MGLRVGRVEGFGSESQWILAARAASKRSNCKGPPGLPCAVTPQGTWPPFGPSNPCTIMTILRTSVCPVVNSHKVGAKTNVRPPGSCRAVAQRLELQRNKVSSVQTSIDDAVAAKFRLTLRQSRREDF